MVAAFRVVLGDARLDLPTRSTPTSAALVKIPPPTRMNRAIGKSPEPKADENGRGGVLEQEHDHRRPEEPESRRRASP